MEFDKLDIADRADILWSHGKFLTTASYHNRKINLYSMFDKYYEVWYDVEGNLIEEIKEMKDGRIFKNYFQKN